MQSYLPYIEKSTANTLIRTVASRLVSDNHGSNSNAYLIDNFCVLKTNNIPIREGYKDMPFNEVVNILHSLKESGTNVVPVLGYYYDEENINDFGPSAYSKGYIIQERAQGSELWDAKKYPSYSDMSQEKFDYLLERLSVLSKAPQEHYDKFVSDYKKIDEKIAIDPSKQSNFFYDSENGFSFIDLNFKNNESCWDKTDVLGQDSHRFFIQHVLSVTLPRRTFDSSSCDELTLSTITDANRIICDKLVNSFLKVGATEENIIDAFKDQQSPTQISGGFSNIGVDKDYIARSLNNIEDPER